MTPDQQQSVALQLTGALLLSVVCGAISLGRRIVKYGRLPLIGVITEMLAAIVAGYLAWDAYPGLVDILYHGITRPIFVSACAYCGGRLFQYAEEVIQAGIPKLGADKAPK